MTTYQYHHLGIPTQQSREREEYFKRFKMYHTNFDDNPFGLEFLRFEPGCPVPELVKTLPHPAFKVDNLEQAIKGQEVIIQPNSPSDGVMVAFILYDGMPIEFLEYDESKMVADFPEIETSRLRLRQIRSDDAEVLFKMRSDPAIMKYMDTASMKDVSEAKDMINKLSLRFIENQLPIWALSLKDDPSSHMMGYAGFIHRDKKHFRAETGYVLSPGYWGKGFVTEAMRAVLEYGFNHMDLHSVTASVNPDNAASIRVLERLKFQKEAHFRESYYYNGTFFDDAVYVLLKRDF